MVLTAVFLTCAGLGIGYLLELKARRLQLNQVVELILYLQREIRCDSAPLPHLLRRCHIPFPLLEAMDCTEPFDLLSSYECAKKKCADQLFLDGEARRALDALFLPLAGET